MQIPNINTLRKNARKDIIDKNSQELNKIIEKRKKTRSKWSEKDNQKFDKYLQDLKIAHCNYIEALKNEIIIKTKLVINDNPNAEGFNLEEPQFIDADIGKFNQTIIFKGKWDKKKKKYSRIVHLEAGIKKTPAEEVNDIFNEHGYNITDVSFGNKTRIRVELKN